MIEEPIDASLDIFGLELVFDQFTIRGIPGFSVEVFLREEHQTYKVNKQLYTFRIATRDYLEEKILKDMQFKVETLTHLVTFCVAIPPVDDMTGWSELICDFLSREALL